MREQTAVMYCFRMSYALRPGNLRLTNAQVLIKAW